jgi:hypothetical protein
MMNLYGKSGREFYRLERRAMRQGRTIKVGLALTGLAILAAGFVFSTYLYGIILFALGVALVSIGVR